MEAVRGHRHDGRPAKTWRAWCNPASLAAVALAAAIALGGWAAAERPATPADFTGRIAGLSFSPYHRGESGESDLGPKRSEIASDLKLAAGITGRIRTYSVSGVLGEIPHLAYGLPLKITAGAWLDGKTGNDSAEIGRLIDVAHSNLNVERVVVGNETLFRHDMPATQLIADIKRVKAAVQVPVTTAETADIWLKNPELVRNVDYIALHVFPYWEGVPLRDAIAFTLGTIREVQKAYPNKLVVIDEIGWPSKGVAHGGAVASAVNQAIFLRAFLNEARQRHLDYFVMEAFDQPWKTSFEGRAAGYWGIFDLDRQPKFAMTGPVTEIPDWPGWAIPAALLAALASLALLSRRPDIRFPGKLGFALLAQGFIATMTGVLIALCGTYLSLYAGAVWIALVLGQAVLLVLLLADSFELAETVWGRVWHRRLEPLAAPAGMPLPKVSIHIPICNEPPAMVRQTLDALAALDYPAFEVLVIDNNTVDPTIWEPVAEHCAKLGARFRFFHLGRWPGYKAGALNFALRQTAADAEVIGVLDSDYIVTPDWLRAMVPEFANPAVGFVQSPQDYRDNDGSLFKRLMFWEYAGFFKLGMVTRNERNAVIQHGTMTLVRKAALEGAEGWAEWCITEDSELGLHLFRQGWLGAYAARSFGRGVMPDDFAAYRKQRHRWAYGAMRICRGHWKGLLSPFDRTLTLGQRWHFLTGWLPWVGDALGLVFLGLGLIWSVALMVAPARFEFPIVLFMLPSIFMFGFKLTQILLLYAARVPCGLADRLAAALGGLALSHTIGKAVWSGLFTSRAPFLRTPKMTDQPALVQGLVMAREELSLLLLSWAALIGVGVTHGVFSGNGTWEATLWCLVLLVQSLPYLASVAVSIIAAIPAAAKRPAEIPYGNTASGPSLPAFARLGGDD
jgi:exo-beta-1,3-glucanase (GH17 family)/cellulose synthase/poly-beta-1,6-N-acetylglucosamine synthase-like glycosyltransferase